jgi:hypothetical protein
VQRLAALSLTLGLTATPTVFSLRKKGKYFMRLRRRFANGILVVQG